MCVLTSEYHYALYCPPLECSCIRRRTCLRTMPPLYCVCVCVCSRERERERQRERERERDTEREREVPNFAPCTSVSTSMRGLCARSPPQDSRVCVCSGVFVYLCVRVSAYMNIVFYNICIRFHNHPKRGKGVRREGGKEEELDT
jgi:hypothetical protein